LLGNEKFSGALGRGQLLRGNTDGEQDQATSRGQSGKPQSGPGAHFRGDQKVIAGDP
jgi:hypothetical protein